MKTDDNELLPAAYSSFLNDDIFVKKQLDSSNLDTLEQFIRHFAHATDWAYTLILGLKKIYFDYLKTHSIEENSSADAFIAHSGNDFSHLIQLVIDQYPNMILEYSDLRSYLINWVKIENAHLPTALVPLLLKQVKKVADNKADTLEFDNARLKSLRIRWNDLSENYSNVLVNLETTRLEFSRLQQQFLNCDNFLSDYYIKLNQCKSELDSWSRKKQLLLSDKTLTTDKLDTLLKYSNEIAPGFDLQELKFANAINQTLKPPENYLTLMSEQEITNYVQENKKLLRQLRKFHPDRLDNHLADQLTSGQYQALKSIYIKSTQLTRDEKRANRLGLIGSHYRSNKRLIKSMLDAQKILSDAGIKFNTEEAKGNVEAQINWYEFELSDVSSELDVAQSELLLFYAHPDIEHYFTPANEPSNIPKLRLQIKNDLKLAQKKCDKIVDEVLNMIENVACSEIN